MFVFSIPVQISFTSLLCCENRSPGHQIPHRRRRLPSTTSTIAPHSLPPWLNPASPTEKVALPFPHTTTTTTTSRRPRSLRHHHHPFGNGRQHPKPPQLPPFQPSSSRLLSTAVTHPAITSASRPWNLRESRLRPFRLGTDHACRTHFRLCRDPARFLESARVCEELKKLGHRLICLSPHPARSRAGASRHI